MPNYYPTTFAHIQAGHTILGRDGRARLIRAIEIEHPFDPNAAFDTLIVTVEEGTYAVEPARSTIVIAATLQEAVVSLMLAFPRSEIIAS